MRKLLVLIILAIVLTGCAGGNSSITVPGQIEIVTRLEGVLVDADVYLRPSDGSDPWEQSGHEYQGQAMGGRKLISDLAPGSYDIKVTFVLWETGTHGRSYGDATTVVVRKGETAPALLDLSFKGTVIR